MQLNLNLVTTYTILFQYCLYEKNTHLILGLLRTQTGINVKETHNLNYYRDLYEHFLELLDITMQCYGVESPDFIVIYLKEIILEVEETLKKINPISQIVLNKSLVKVGETKRLFNNNIIPITYNLKDFGHLLEGRSQRSG